MHSNQKQKYCPEEEEKKRADEMMGNMAK